MTATQWAGVVHRDALLSPDGAYRYWLRREWGPGQTAVFVMLNPSTADAAVDDPTIRRCTSFARAWEYGALDVVNLYALRSTDPAALAGHPDPVGPGNRLRQRLALDGAGVVVAAWGAHPAARPAATAFTELAGELAVPLHCLGTTKDGAPRHPLYVRGDTPLTPYTPAPARSAP